MSQQADRLKELYYNPTKAGSFGGQKGLWRGLSEQGINTDKISVSEWLSAQDDYTLHKPARINGVVTQEDILLDKGIEFLNREFQNLLKSHKIHNFTTGNESKALIVERFNRTIKTKMWRYFTANNTLTYLDRVQEFNAYNHIYHRSIKMRPVEVNKTNYFKVFKNVYGPFNQRNLDAPHIYMVDLSVRRISKLLPRLPIHWIHSNRSTARYLTGLCGTFLPCILACKVAQDQDESCCLPFLPGALIALRTRIRDMYGIGGSVCDDWVVMSCCSLCGICQMAREQKMRR
ncbi:CNFN protein, partial [Amia calva]|nr:CNFN protein [Amia calva]